jgi:hypothetical protein
MRPCLTPGCPRPARARGLCMPHYDLIRDHGGELPPLVPQPVRPLADRFWEKVSPEPNTGCFLWTGTLVDGYGAIWSGVRMVRASRVAWSLTHGRVPDELLVCHTCDFPPCVNPAHLFLGTGRDNSQDMVAKGRHASQVDPLACSPFGERHPKAKLTETVVREMRRLHTEEGWGGKRLAKRFGIEMKTAYDVIRRRSWKHVA